jgi:hypothetical protein
MFSAPIGAISEALSYGEGWVRTHSTPPSFSTKEPLLNPLNGELIFNRILYTNNLLSILYIINKI